MKPVASNPIVDGSGTSAWGCMQSLYYERESIPGVNSPWLVVSGGLLRES